MSVFVNFDYCLRFFPLPTVCSLCFALSRIDPCLPGGVLLADVILVELGLEVWVVGGWRSRNAHGRGGVLCVGGMGEAGEGCVTA